MPGSKNYMPTIARLGIVSLGKPFVFQGFDLWPPGCSTLLKTQDRQEIVNGPISGMESPGFSAS